MATHPRHFLTPEQYLDLERKAVTKSEYYRGEMFAMSGATRSHGILTINLASILHRQLRGRECTAYSNDLRILVGDSGLHTYPDLSVVCGEARFADQHFDTLLNPVFIAEVLSPSTEAYDRGRKFEQYRSIDSLRHYVLVAQDRMNVDLFTLEDGRWILSSVSRPEQILRLDAINCEIPIGELYEKVVFSAEDAPQPTLDDPHRI